MTLRTDIESRIRPIPEKPNPVGTMRIMAGHTREPPPDTFRVPHPGEGVGFLRKSLGYVGPLGNIRVAVETDPVRTVKELKHIPGRVWAVTRRTHPRGYRRMDILFREVRRFVTLETRIRHGNVKEFFVFAHVSPVTRQALAHRNRTVDVFIVELIPVVAIVTKPWDLLPKNRHRLGCVGVVARRTHPRGYRRVSRASVRRLKLAFLVAHETEGRRFHGREFRRVGRMGIVTGPAHASPGR